MPLMPRLDETDLDKPASPAAGPATLAPGHEFGSRVELALGATNHLLEVKKVLAGMAAPPVEASAR